ncbi:nuclear export mediator factor NEMF homolog [Acyrthosiphon pisum]|uniref:Nuclear export mediator factor NEMF homolog n=1 Tax=Acyrthosiphon pisum TaxID=7029 RepID=A0A8R1VZY2_ACYPI|nr:nuclear export mediator factor NEMF homolog [Acyrthosiphon pisum]|eukprot:XP_001945685.2 PREDICTED: nuclear export mediator factor NEMF homolog [Acyrthosiphon pisum]
MKTRFSTLDIMCVVNEIQKYKGMRLQRVYDIDHKTYLFKFQLNNEKCVLLLESGVRLHVTNYEWTKNEAPSSFSMKLRKHLSNKRLEKLTQMGFDRIIDLQFGVGEAAYHVILELYDKGNIILADKDYIMINILRPHTEDEKQKFFVKEVYPNSRPKNRLNPPTEDSLIQILKTAKHSTNLKKFIFSNFPNCLDYGNCLLEHMLISGGFPTNTRIGIEFNIDTDIQKLMNCFCIAEKFLDNITTLKEGFIIQKIDQQLLPDGIMKELCTNQEYHPFLFAQHQKLPSKTYESFNEAVDEFYSNLESQKYDVKCMQQEKGAVKKLQNIVKDHEERLKKLQDTQDEHKFKAELITNNLDLVDNTIQFVRQAVAKQLHWDEIWDMIRQLNFEDDGCTYAIVKNLKLSVNHITLQLFDPYNEENKNEENSQLIDIDLGQSAFGNAERYYGSKKQSAIKEKKTIDSSSTVLKMAEKKTKQTLKDMQVVASINKVRKTYWFEKFYWFISSENYLVIAGRDAHQNEVIVKRYMKSSDVYVHAGFSGATTVIIKNPINQPVPPATLNEAAVMAISYSVSWTMKINLQNAFWVKPEQVSKTAPTGEYLTTGSFMIRGKKNYLPATHLILGLSFLFKLEDSSIPRHANERKIKGIECEGLDNIEQNNDEFENIPSENDSDEDLEKNIETQNEETSYTVNDDGQSLDVKTNNKHSEEEAEKEELRFNNETSKNVIDVTSIPNCSDTCKSVEQSDAASSDSDDDDDDIELDDVNDLDKKNESNKPQILKRGQRGKLKRIKEKYKDQDEDEREMRIKLLQSSMNEDKKLKRAKKKDKKNKKSTDKNKAAGNKKIFIKPLPMLLEAPNDTIQLELQKEPIKKSEDNENSEDDETDKPTDLTETHMLDSLTGVPYAEDELLFAVPVVAPYTALTNYKYKLKLTPGNTKRGKASKTCLNLFLKDKTSTTREKNLMKSVNVQDIARNIPNGVKLSAPSLSKVLNK